MKIEILGPGCAKCKQLATQAEAAAKELGLQYTIEKVTSIEEIVDKGVLVTPGLVVDGQLKASGRIPSIDEMKKLLV